jgi:hypothetical protein
VLEEIIADIDNGLGQKQIARPFARHKTPGEGGADLTS